VRERYLWGREAERSKCSRGRVKGAHRVGKATKRERKKSEFQTAKVESGDNHQRGEKKKDLIHERSFTRKGRGAKSGLFDNRGEGRQPSRKRNLKKEKAWSGRGTINSGVRINAT